VTYLISQTCNGFHNPSTTRRNSSSGPIRNLAIRDTVRRSYYNRSSILKFGFGAAAGALFASAYLSTWLMWAGVNLI
jgi:hypothetical protein